MLHHESLMNELPRTITASADAGAAAHADLPRSRRWLHRYAVVLALATWVLIFAGGMVTSTGSGLAVPDWPTSYGYNMFAFPYSQWVGGIFYEHGHRLIASTVGLLTIGLCIWLWVTEPRRWLRKLGYLALAAVIVQGILGGLTVRYFLPTPVSVAHACLAQTFLCIVVSIAVFTSPRWLRSSTDGNPAASREAQVRFQEENHRSASIQTPHLGVLLTAIVFLQLILGAIMRHTESGLAVPDFPLAYGQVIPGFDEGSVADYNDYRRFTLGVPAVTVGQIASHMAHRAGALLVTAVVFIVGILTLRRHGDRPLLTRPVMLAMGLVLLQIALGAWTVLSQKLPVIATAHVAVGAATLAVAWVFTLRAHRYIGVARTEKFPRTVGVAGATG